MLRVGICTQIKSEKSEMAASTNESNMETDAGERESGEAMEDGSFPIVDMADLRNAIQANGRARDIEAARAHIIKRAEALDAMDMIPEEWMGEGDGKDKKGVAETAPPAAKPRKPDDSQMMQMREGAKADDESVESTDMSELIAEFRNLTDEMQ